MTFFGKNLATIRESRNLDHKEFGKAIGVPGKQVRFYEDGFSEPDLADLVDICGKLEVSIDKMLTHDIAALEAGINGAEIKLLVLDVDGVLTDGGMYYSENGDRIKRFNVKDGRAIRKLTEHGYEVGFLSGGSQASMIQSRAEVLGVKRVATSIKDKLAVLKTWQKELSLTPAQIAVIGDDINDLQIIEYCGLSACPADAVDKVQQAAKVVLNRKGGEGCVREFVEQYLMEVP